MQLWTAIIHRLKRIFVRLHAPTLSRVLYFLFNFISGKFECDEKCLSVARIFQIFITFILQSTNSRISVFALICIRVLEKRHDNVFNISDVEGDEIFMIWITVMKMKFQLQFDGVKWNEHFSNGLCNYYFIKSDKSDKICKIPL